jgi:uncharacterized protein
LNIGVKINKVMEKYTNPFYVLSLDGGGSLGVYTLGVLKKIEDFIWKTEQKKLYEKFNLVYGTSTGSIIASLIALGKSVDEISKLYFQYVPNIMKDGSPSEKTHALSKCASEVFENKRFTSRDDDNFKTLIGVVATNYKDSQPLIFKSYVDLMVQDGIDDARDGFDCSVADAVVASCSAYPFFDKPIIKLGPPSNQNITMIDGGYSANNPTLFAIIDAKKILEIDAKKILENENKVIEDRQIHVLNVGVGYYHYASTNRQERFLRKIDGIGSKIELFENTLKTSSNTLDIIRNIVFKEVNVIRVSDENARISTNLMESDLKKLYEIQAFGDFSYANIVNQERRKKIETMLRIKNAH